MDIDIFAIFRNLAKAFIASSFFSFLKFLGAFAFVILLIADILLLSRRLKGDWKVALYGANVPPLKKTKYQKFWERIKSNVASGDLSKAKIAVIEADKMLGETLELIGYKGKDTGEKIAAVRPGQLVGIEEARQAHDIFKKIVHSRYKIGTREILTALEGYEKVFRGLDLLD